MTGVRTIEVDVAVVGAGSAGVSAAVSAAECGARTVLVEASGGVGGTLVWQLLENSAGFHDVNGSTVVGGFGQRLIDLLKSAGGTPGHIRDDVGYTATRTPVNHAELSMAEAVMLREAGVRLLLQTRVVDVESVGRNIRALVAYSSDGRTTIVPRVVVDASGDAVVAAAAGARMQEDASLKQPASLTFKVANLDHGPLLDYANRHPLDFREGSVFGSSKDEYVNLWGFGGLLAEGWSSGALSLRRTEMHFAGWPRRREAIVNVSRVTLSDQAPESIGNAYLHLQQQVLEFARWFRTSMPGGAGSYVAAIADRIGVRESRRVLGVETITESDIVDAAPRRDAVGRGAFPIDIHDSTSPGLSHAVPVGSGYGIPYGALVVADIDNLLVAGRCVSTTHEANGSVRITATCFVTGEAAGVAAAQASEQGISPIAVNVEGLRRTLRDRGAVL